VPLEDGEVLGEQRGLEPGLRQDLADRRRRFVGAQDLQDPDPRRVGERLEQVGLDLVERLVAAAEGRVRDDDRRVT
jgi:hypothetical protein